MPARELWFDRQFMFDTPPTRFVNVLERLRGTPDRLEERTSGLDVPALTRHVPGHWSIQEQAGHLLDLESLWLRRVEQFVAGETELVAADMTNRKTHEAQHNARALTALLGGFRGARSQLLRLLDAVDETIVVRTARHPRLQRPMRLLDFAVFVAEHDDHHLATITELRRRGR